MHLLSLGIIMNLAALAADPEGAKGALYPDVEKYVQQRIAEFDQIPEERKGKLKELSQYVQSRMDAKSPIRLTFICTHNSRRSHMSQIWAATAASYYGISNVETFSGGTDATAFNPRAIAAMQRAGFKVSKGDGDKNPRYSVRYHDKSEPMVCFSKVYGEAPNPSADYCAVMTCSQADASCPIVTGSALRIAIPFDDPKVADNTPEEAAKYDERCAQICREIFYVFSQVKK